MQNKAVEKYFPATKPGLFLVKDNSPLGFSGFLQFQWNRHKGQLLGIDGTYQKHKTLDMFQFVNPFPWLIVALAIPAFGY